MDRKGFKAWNWPARARRPGRPAPGGPLAPLLLALGAAATAGCPSGDAPAPPAVRGGPYGNLPALRATPDEQLQTELARVVEAGGTPEQLAQVAAAGRNRGAAELEEIFAGRGTDELKAIRAESDEIFPEGPFVFDPIRLERAVRFRRAHDRERLAFQEALDEPDCRVSIDYEAGPAADLAFLDPAWIGARLEAFHAAEALAGEDLDPAVESLLFMLRAAECLAGEPHPTVRLEAAFLRTEAFLVLQAVAKHPNVAKGHLDTVLAHLRRQLDQWPDDALAWIGDRAMGLVFYEAVRDGKLEDFLTADEAERLDREGIFEEFNDAALRHVNEDQLYYLRAMAQVVESCRLPYHARRADFEALRKDLHAKRNEPDFPLIAARLLLPDIEKGHVIQARDRANAEGWVLALALGLGTPPPPLQANPLTGEPYRVERDGHSIAVFDIGSNRNGDNPPWVVPDWTNRTP